MTIVLLVGGGLGWESHRVKVQREAVAALELEGFQISYHWGWSGTRFDSKVSNSRWLQWLIDRLGTDYFLNVSEVYAAPKNPELRVDDRLMAAIGSLGKLESLVFNSMEGVTSDRLALLAGLTHLRYLSLGTDIQGDGLIHLKRMTNLQTLSQL